MAELNRETRLPKIASELPEHPLTPVVALLLQYTDIGLSLRGVVDLATMLTTDTELGYAELVDIDRSIGGVGLHNVNRQEGDVLRGSYRIELRPLFRPIQYVQAHVLDQDPVWAARDIVRDSCLHVENAVKFRFTIRQGDRRSLGQLLGPETTMGQLAPRFLELLTGLNRVVYRAAKHSVEEISIDAHRFTPADALTIYLTCRWAGVELLQPTGVFNDWERPLQMP